MNIYDLPPLPLADELTDILDKSENVRIERIVSTGQISDWYDQTETEFVALLQGNAKIEYANGNVVSLEKGDTLLIKPHERHRVVFTTSDPPCIWLCVFYGNSQKHFVLGTMA
jgi:cupin 2 domain-containing protein